MIWLLSRCSLNADHRHWKTNGGINDRNYRTAAESFTWSASAHWSVSAAATVAAAAAAAVQSCTGHIDLNTYTIDTKDSIDIGSILAC